MSRELIFLLLGLGLGGAYALLGLGVVSVYRASGVPNFEQGSMAMFSAFVFYNLRPEVGWVSALVVTVLFAMLLGLFFYGLVMRQLRTAPLMAQIAATISLLVMLHGIALVVFPLVPTTPTSILPSGIVHLGAYGVPRDRFYVAGIAFVAAVILQLVSRRTRFGLATRAVSETEKGVILIGLSPAKLGAANWALSSAFAALAGVLLSPIAGLDQDILTLLIVPVFAAALLARFTSFTISVLAGFGLGMMQSLLQLYSIPGAWYTWLWTGPGRADAFPALVLIVAMVVSGRVIPQRDTVMRSRLPASPQPRKVALGVTLLIAAAMAMALTLPLSWVAALTASATLGIVSASLVLLTGYAGQISLAQLSFAGLGGFVAARLAADGHAFLTGLVAAALAGALVGCLVGIPALRVRGPALAIMTLGVSLALYYFVFINGQLLGSHKYLQFKDFPHFAGYAFTARTFSILCSVALALTVLLLVAIRHSSLGLSALLVRESERSAIVAGINVPRLKIGLFSLSAMIAAVGGALLTHAQLVYSYDSYTVFQSMLLFVVVYISGIGMASGAVIAGIAGTGGLVTNVLVITHVTKYQEIFGGLLLLSLQLHPDGLATLPEQFRRAFRRKTSTPAGVQLATDN